MPNIFFASDHHFQHANILKFTDKAGNLIRPGFRDIQQHDNTIIYRHNQVVKDDDLVYFLGDVTWKRNEVADEILSAMKGRKRVVGGNHDDINWLVESGHFEKVYTWKYFPEFNIIASHMPLAYDDLREGIRNIHGHTHQKMVGVDYMQDLSPVTESRPHSDYYNASMESIGYTPRSIDEIQKVFNERIQS